MFDTVSYNATSSNYKHHILSVTILLGGKFYIRFTLPITNLKRNLDTRHAHPFCYQTQTFTITRKYGTDTFQSVYHEHIHVCSVYHIIQL